MVIVGNWRTALIGSIVSLIIFGVIYFTVIKPDNNTAQQAIRNASAQGAAALAQGQQVLNQAASQANSSGSPAAKAAVAAGSKAISSGQKLLACQQAAGTDASALEACATKYTP